MRNFVAGVLVSLAVSASGCATEGRTTAGLVRIDPGVNIPPTKALVWSCPSDKGPDPARGYPNCDGPALPPSLAWQEAHRAAQEKAQADLAAARAEGERSALARQEATTQQEETAPAAEPQQAGGGECPPPKVVAVEKRVDFPTAGYQLSEASKETLKDVAKDVKSDSKVAEIRVSGNADSTGKEEINKELSIKRAAAVKEYLEQEGVPAEQIQMHALGDSSPVASNETRDGRALNRSSEVVVIATGEGG